MPTMQPNPNTITVVVVFATIYLAMVFRRTSAGKLDLYDLVMLSMVAIVPGVFTLLPDAASLIGHLTGVAFPFVVMFGVLFLVIFVFMHRMTMKLHRLERQNTILVQELSLLSLKLDEREEAQIRV